MEKSGATVAELYKDKKLSCEMIQGCLDYIYDITILKRSGQFCENYAILFELKIFP